MPDIKNTTNKKGSDRKSSDDFIRSGRGYETVERELPDLFGENKKRSRSSRLILVLIVF